MSLPGPQQGYEVYILMEYCSGGGLLDLLNTRLRNRLSEQEVLEIFGDVCKGVAAMHHLDPPVAHRDLKIENILIVSATAGSKRPIYKLCDFGSAKPVLSRRPPRSMDELKRLEADLNRSTTLPYRPPEMVDVYQRRVIDEKADIWALGVLLYKLCYYTTPFEENGGGPLAILNVKYRFPSNPPYSDRIKGLVASLLVDPSTKRPSIDELLIRVYGLLGLPPPAAAQHYAQQALSGKQTQALPQVVQHDHRSSTQSGRPNRALDDDVLVQISKGAKAGADHFDKDTGHARNGRGSSRPLSMAMRPSVSNEGSGRGSMDNNDLISFDPGRVDSYDPRSKAKETERVMKMEGIEPMRRGRPTNASASKASPGKLQLDAFGLADTKAPTDAARKQNKSHVVKSPMTSPGHAGFGDSFTPNAPSDTDPSAVAVAAASGALSPPPADSVRQGAISPNKPGQTLPSPPSKDQERSGTSNEVANSVVSKGDAAGDTSAEGRFPSLEELDRRYPENRAAKDQAQEQPRPSSDAVASPKARESSMASLTSSFEAMSKRNAADTRPTPALPPRSKQSWRSSHFASADSAKLAGSKEEALSSQLNTESRSHQGKELEEASSSSEVEEEAPEDPGASGSVRRRWAQYTSKQESQPSAKAENTALKPENENVRTSGSGHVGKIAPPDWLVEHQRAISEQDSGKAKLPSPRRQQSTAKPLPLPGRKVTQPPLIDFTPDLRSGEFEPPARKATLQEGTTAAQVRAPSWDWDGEDEDEMRRLRAPTLGSDGQQQAPSHLLVDVEEPQQDQEPAVQRAGLSSSGQLNLLENTDGAPSETDMKRKPSEQRAIPVEEPKLQQASFTRAEGDANGGERLRSPRTQGDTPVRELDTDRSTGRSMLAADGNDVAPNANMVGGHRAYAKGTAQSMASRWESMGGAIQDRPTSGSRTVDRPNAPQQSGVSMQRSSSSGMKSDSIDVGRRHSRPMPPSKPQMLRTTPTPSSTKGNAPQPPPPTKPAALRQPSGPISSPDPQPPAPSTAGVKPWEREEAERAEVQKFGYVRAGRTEPIALPSQESYPDGEAGAADALPSPSKPSPLPPPTSLRASPSQRGSSETTGDPHQRYTSVASLIDRWQANAKSTQPETGWGEIGGAGRGRPRLPGRDV